MIPYIMTNRSVTVYLGTSSEVIDESHPNYQEIRDVIVDLSNTSEGTTQYGNLLAELMDLINVARAVERWSEGAITVEDGIVFFDDEEVHNVVTDRILDAMDEGRSPAVLARFLTKLMDNPSNSAVEELYLFLEHNDIVIDNDGDILAYKKVRHDYTDIHTGTFDNSIGATPEMKRRDVDDRRENTCSRGLHFCAQHYLPSFGSSGQDRVMVVKVNPADVVSIPHDYNNAKGRTWKYQVIGEVEDLATTLMDFIGG